MVKNDKYILVDREPVAVDDLFEWARWYEKNDRIVKQENIGEARVSTVFLGLDHSFGQGEPMLFETMVFGGKLDQEQDRCATWKQAEVMHVEMVKRVEMHKESLLDRLLDV